LGGGLAVVEFGLGQAEVGRAGCLCFSRPLLPLLHLLVLHCWSMLLALLFIPGAPSTPHHPVSPRVRQQRFLGEAAVADDVGVVGSLWRGLKVRVGLFTGEPEVEKDATTGRVRNDQTEQEGESNSFL